MLPKPGSKSQPIFYAQSPVKSAIKGIKGKESTNLNTQFLNLGSHPIIIPSNPEPLPSPGRYKEEKQPKTNLIKGDPENFYQAQYKIDSQGPASPDTSDSEANDNLDHINFGDPSATRVLLR